MTLFPATKPLTRHKAIPKRYQFTTAQRRLKAVTTLELVGRTCRCKNWDYVLRGHCTARCRMAKDISIILKEFGFEYPDMTLATARQSAIVNGPEGENYNTKRAKEWQAHRHRHLIFQVEGLKSKVASKLLYLPDFRTPIKKHILPLTYGNPAPAQRQHQIGATSQPGYQSPRIQFCFPMISYWYLFTGGGVCVLL